MSDDDVEVVFGEIGDSMILSESELADLMLIANQGDGEAAHKIFDHYAFTSTKCGDDAAKEARKWLRKSADLGFKEAQRYLANKETGPCHNVNSKLQ